MKIHVMRIALSLSLIYSSVSYSMDTPNIAGIILGAPEKLVKDKQTEYYKLHPGASDKGLGDSFTFKYSELGNLIKISHVLYYGDGGPALADIVSKLREKYGKESFYTAELARKTIIMNWNFYKDKNLSTTDNVCGRGVQDYLKWQSFNSYYANFPCEHYIEVTLILDNSTDMVETFTTVAESPMIEDLDEKSSQMIKKEKEEEERMKAIENGRTIEIVL